MIMFKFFRLRNVLIAISLSVSSLGVNAQQTNPATNPPSATAVTPKLPFQPFENMFELPVAVLQALALETKQKELLDKALMARRQLWSAMRNARLEEYAALTKALDKDTFDPKEVISLRKKIRANAEKRMDDVQTVWLDFWESLNPGQRKTLVAYMKQQHATNLQLSYTRTALERAANLEKAAQEKAVSAPAQSK
jgi:Spy/CpxP family protein refolding chaperone